MIEYWVTNIETLRSIGVSGAITNTGHGVIFRTFAASHAEILNITGGPLSYKYRFSEIHIHFARTDEKGSEHLISGYQFPAEKHFLT
ncbi:UNVERIFIED_CONTAM: Carbonic anhydrase-related protein 10 [Trichonephila clavipes]